MGGQNEPLFLASRAPCRSPDAGCGCDPCLRLATGERTCLRVGGCDDGGCRRHSYTGAFSFSRHGLIARREKPSSKRRNAPEDPATGAPPCERIVRSLPEAFARVNACPERLLSRSQGAASVAAPGLLIATEVMVKTDKTASPMPNGGMAEAGF
jgi:hypothetical protein